MWLKLIKIRNSLLNIPFASTSYLWASSLSMSQSKSPSTETSDSASRIPVEADPGAMNPAPALWIRNQRLEELRTSKSLLVEVGREGSVGWTSGNCTDLPDAVTAVIGSAASVVTSSLSLAVEIPSLVPVSSEYYTFTEGLKPHSLDLA